MDNLSRDDRRRTMQRVTAKNTKPEMVVRRLTHALGYRYRLHRSDLPGKPDLVFPSRRAVIFVHGCWWHCHTCKRAQRTPKTNTQYWNEKRSRNRRRDQRVQRQLRRQGWRVMVVWECQLPQPLRLGERIQRFLG